MNTDDRDETGSWNRYTGFLLLLFVGQAIALSLVRSGTSYDGAEQLLYTQYLDWGYGRSQPPLYTWMLIALHRVFGVGMLAENLLKFGLLFLGFWSVAEITRRLGFGRAVAAAALAAPFLIVEIGWESQRNYAHTVLTFALTGGLGVAYLAARETPGATRHLAIGVMMGLLVLSKYNGALVIAALVAADLAVGKPRVFARPSSVVAWLAAAVIAIPHLVWVAGNTGHALVLADNFRAAEGAGLLATALKGIGQYLLATAGLLALLAVALAVYTIRSPRASPPPRHAPAVSVIALWGLAFWLVGLVVTLATGATVVRMRWLAPVVVMAVPVLVGWAFSRRPGRETWFALGGMALGVGLVAGQWYESTRMNARTDYDYRRLAEELAQSGPTDAIVTAEYEVFANLRLHDHPILAPQMPRVDRGAAEGATALWFADGRAGDRVEGFARSIGLCPVQSEPVREIALHRRHGDAAPRRVSAMALSAEACGG
ncbi:glycosyltransferase family 39 protein [Aquibium carbonis]|nr:glycosyltransferase family 39 protein [Aquibium carbonis]